MRSHNFQILTKSYFHELLNTYLNFENKIYLEVTNKHAVIDDSPVNHFNIGLYKKIQTVNNKAFYMFLLWEKINDSFESLNKFCIKHLDENIINLQNIPHDFILNSENYYYHVMSFFDTIARLTSIMYKKHGHEIKSKSFIKQMEDDALRNMDPVYYDYINSNLQWIYELKDIRDGLAHYAESDFRIKEHTGRPIFIILYLVKNKDGKLERKETNVIELLSKINEGASDFILFYVSHFKKNMENNLYEYLFEQLKAYYSKIK